MNIKDQPWLPFAESLSKDLFEHGAEQAICITRNIKEDRIAVNYFNCDFEMRCVLIGHLINDLVLEVIDSNRDLVRDILDGKYAEDEEEEEEEET